MNRIVWQILRSCALYLHCVGAAAVKPVAGTSTSFAPSAEVTLDHLRMGRGLSVTVIVPLLRLARAAFPGCLTNHDVEAVLRTHGVLSPDVVSGTDAASLTLQFIDHDAALTFLLRCNAFVSARLTEGNAPA